MDDSTTWEASSNCSLKAWGCIGALIEYFRFQSRLKGLVSQYSSETLWHNASVCQAWLMTHFVTPVMWHHKQGDQVNQSFSSYRLSQLPFWFWLSRGFCRSSVLEAAWGCMCDCLFEAFIALYEFCVYPRPKGVLLSYIPCMFRPECLKIDSRSVSSIFIWKAQIRGGMQDSASWDDWLPMGSNTTRRHP